MNEFYKLNLQAVGKPASKTAHYRIAVLPSLISGVCLKFICPKSRATIMILAYLWPSSFFAAIFFRQLLQSKNADKPKRQKIQNGASNLFQAYQRMTIFVDRQKMK